MSITLVVFTDGRDYIYGTLPTALAMLEGPISRRVIYDDSGDALNRDRLAEAFPDFVIAYHPDGRQGFGGAIRFMWHRFRLEERMEKRELAPYVFHLEDDFLFNREVNLTAMCQLLDTHPSLAQVVLKRQAWSHEEIAAGGVVERNPGAYVEHEWGDHHYLTHREFWSTNPCVYRRSLCARGWPEDPFSEGKFGAMIRDESVAMPFAYWGARNDPPLVTHVGNERAGVGY